MGRMIADPSLTRVAVGLFFGAWTAWGADDVARVFAGLLSAQWPQEVFVMFIPIIPLEQFMRNLIGMVIGTGVIAGLRAMSIVKPTEAIY